MRLYLYCSQDLIIKSEGLTTEIKSGNICRINLLQNEMAYIYPKYCQGVIVVDNQILCNQLHQQINFYTIDNTALLCEIKPFVNFCEFRQFDISNSNIKLIQYNEQVYIEFNNQTYGNLIGKLTDFQFDKLIKNKKEYGLLVDSSNKQLILCNQNEIIYSQSFIDYEIKEKYIQIYSHPYNIFNLGQLTKFDFESDAVATKLVVDRKNEQINLSNQFNAIYFLDAIKCKRFKYAYNLLSYELRANISTEILNKYFQEFDNYIYLDEEKIYITLKNNKVVGVYHFVIKDNYIDNIY